MSCYFEDVNTGTKVGFFRYDGGEGWDNKNITIGVCKEDIDTVYNLLKDKFIISRCKVAPKGTVDFSYGLTIDSFEPVCIYGVTNVVTGSIEGIIKILNDFSQKEDIIKRRRCVK